MRADVYVHHRVVIDKTKKHPIPLIDRVRPTVFKCSAKFMGFKRGIKGIRAEELIFLPCQRLNSLRQSAELFVKLGRKSDTVYLSLHDDTDTLPHQLLQILQNAELPGLLLLSSNPYRLFRVFLFPFAPCGTRGFFRVLNLPAPSRLLREFFWFSQNQPPCSVTS